MICWSPFYGKINTFNKIIYFDWSFNIGGGQLTAKSNAPFVAIIDPMPDKIESESFPGLFFKTAVRIYINKRFHVGVEYNRDWYQAGGPYRKKDVKPDEKLRYRSEVVFFTGFNF